GDQAAGRRQRPQARLKRRQPQHELQILRDEQEVADGDEDAQQVGCCPALRMPTGASLTVVMSECWKAPPAGWRAGLSWAGRRAWWTGCRLVVGDFADGGAGGFFVDDGLAGCVGGDEGCDGEVVDGPGVAACGGVDERGGVVGEQRVGSSGELDVVGGVAGWVGGGGGGRGGGGGGGVRGGGGGGGVGGGAGGGVGGEGGGGGGVGGEVVAGGEGGGVGGGVAQQVGFVEDK